MRLSVPTESNKAIVIFGKKIEPLVRGTQAPSADVEFETRSFPNLLVATLATLPSVSEIPFLDSRERLRLVDCNCASVDSEILP
jgi:hypothetical protein